MVRSGLGPIAAMLNPDPHTYRLTEVCLVCGSEAAYTALLARRRSVRERVAARLRDDSTWHVEPFMTREMLDVLVRDIGFDSELRAQWLWNSEAVLSDAAAGDEGQRWLRPDRRGLYAVGAFESVGSYDWTWSEVAPPWPGGDVSAGAIVGLLTAPVANTWPIANQIKAKAGIRELAKALHATEDGAVRGRLCNLIARRERGDAALAIPALLELLLEPDAAVRSEAADAIAQIAQREGSYAVRAVSPGAGQAVLTALACEADARARALLAGALGALRHEPAISVLIEQLEDDAWLVRREGAWSLGALRAPEAEVALHRALVRENDAQVAKAMRSALAAITGKHLTDPPAGVDPDPFRLAAGTRPRDGARSAVSRRVRGYLPG
jgi:hypothetical protein